MQNSTFWRYCFWKTALFSLVFSLPSPSSYAFGIRAVEGGGVYSTPTAYDYITLGGRAFGGQFDVLLDSPFPASVPSLAIFHDITSLHVSGVFESFSILNNGNMNNSYIDFFAGLRFHSPGPDHPIAPFVGFDLGYSLSLLSISGFSGTVGNSSGNFAAQIVSGVAVPVYHNFGVVAQLPVRFIFARNNLMTFDAVVSVRYAL